MLKGVFKINNRMLQIIGLMELHYVNSIALVSVIALITQLNLNIILI